MEGRGHVPLDFHVPTEETLHYKCQSPKGKDQLKIQENQRWYRTPSLVTGRRRLVGGPGYEKMRVATVVGTYESYPTKLLVHLGGFAHIHNRIGWVSGLHGNSPLVHWNHM
jgi:hypothetical protein